MCFLRRFSLYFVFIFAIICIYVWYYISYVPPAKFSEEEYKRHLRERSSGPSLYDAIRNLGENPENSFED